MNPILRLPFDVAHEIWRHLDRIDLQNASLVNSILRDYSQGELFRVLRFECGPKCKSNKPFADLVSGANVEDRHETTRLLREQQELRLYNLSQHPRLLSYICEIDVVERAAMVQFSGDFYKNISCALPQLLNLRWICCWGVMIPTVFFNAIIEHSIRQYLRISLLGCNMFVRPGTIPVVTKPLLVTRLDLRNGESVVYPIVFPSEHFRHTTATLGTLRVDYHNLHLLESVSLPHLRNFALHPHHKYDQHTGDFIARFLEDNPTISSISLPPNVHIAKLASDALLKLNQAELSFHTLLTLATRPRTLKYLKLDICHFSPMAHLTPLALSTDTIKIELTPHTWHEALADVLSMLQPRKSLSLVLVRGEELVCSPSLYNRYRS